MEHQHLEPCDLANDDDPDAEDEVDPEEQVDQHVNVDGDVADSEEDNASAEEDDDQTATVMNAVVRSLWTGCLGSGSPPLQKTRTLISTCRSETYTSPTTLVRRNSLTCACQ